MSICHSFIACHPPVDAQEAFSMGQAFFAEAFGTLIIMLVILSLVGGPFGCG